MLAATRWPSNAELIRDLAEKLGYLDPGKLTLDPTYGRGIFWKLWQPHPGMLVTHHRPDDDSDFRALPYPDGHFGQIAYDPPYAAEGGAATSTMRDYAERYGRDTVASAAFAVQLLVNDGLAEMWRLVAEGGIVLVKVMDYIWNADLWLGTHWTTAWAIELGFVVEEELRMYDIAAGAQPFLSACINCGLPVLRRSDHVTWTDRKRSLGGGPSNTCRLADGTPGDVPHTPDPDAKTQDHAAYSCLSTMLVLRKPTGKRPRQYRFADFTATDPTRLAL